MVSYKLNVELPEILEFLKDEGVLPEYQPKYVRHINSVIKYSSILADKYISQGKKVDKEECVISAYFHDISKKGRLKKTNKFIVNKLDLNENHCLDSACSTYDFLSELELFSLKKIERIKNNILCHSKDYDGERPSLESQILVSADTMSHIDMLYSRVRHNKPIYNTNNLEQGWNCMLNIAKRMKIKEYAAILRHREKCVNSQIKFENA